MTTITATIASRVVTESLVDKTQDTDKTETLEGRT